MIIMTRIHLHIDPEGLLKKSLKFIIKHLQCIKFRVHACIMYDRD